MHPGAPLPYAKVDPRSDVSFAKYQGHELRLPTEWFDDKANGGSGGGGGGVVGDGEKRAAGAEGTGGAGDRAGVCVGATGARGGAEVEGGAAEKRGEAKVSTSHGEIHAFLALPSSRYVVYQLCDVALPGVQAVLSSLTADPDTPPRCLEQLGFLSRAGGDSSTRTSRHGSDIRVGSSNTWDLRCYKYKPPSAVSSIVTGVLHAKPKPKPPLLCPIPRAFVVQPFVRSAVNSPPGYAAMSSPRFSRRASHVALPRRASHVALLTLRFSRRRARRRELTPQRRQHDPDVP